MMRASRRLAYFAFLVAICSACATSNTDDGAGVEPPIGAAVADGGNPPSGDAAARPEAGRPVDAAATARDAGSDAVATSFEAGDARCVSGEAPSVELCNAVDDDCDGRVDNGCPMNSTLGATEASQLYGGTGGSPFDGACPAGQALVGFEGRSGDRLDAVAPVCAVIELEAIVLSPELNFRVRTRTPTIQPIRGGTGGGVFSDRCATDEIVIGLGGRSGSGVDMLAFTCGSVTFERVSGAFAPVVTTTTTSATHGGTGGGALSYGCGPGRIASGITGRAGSKVDAMSLTCALVTFTTTP